MWVARDKNGDLVLAASKPIRNIGDNCWRISNISDCTDWMLLDESLFPNLKWEDEPIEVSLIPSKLEIVKGKPCEVCSHMGCLSNNLKCIY